MCALWSKRLIEKSEEAKKDYWERLERDQERKAQDQKEKAHEAATRQREQMEEVQRRKEAERQVLTKDFRNQQAKGKAERS
jgi:hypothetical protein